MQIAHTASNFLYNKKILRFADENLIQTINGYIKYIDERNENARLTGLYNEAVFKINNAYTEAKCKNAAEKFYAIKNFKDSKVQAEQCLEKAEICRKNAIYNLAKTKMTGTHG